MRPCNKDIAWARQCLDHNMHSNEPRAERGGEADNGGRCGPTAALPPIVAAARLGSLQAPAVWG